MGKIPLWQNITSLNIFSLSALGVKKKPECLSLHITITLKLSFVAVTRHSQMIHFIINLLLIFLIIVHVH